MTWSYRVVDHGHYVALHEAFYSKKGKVQGWTDKPIEFVSGTVEELREALARALVDTWRFAPLDEAEELKRLEARRKA